MSLTVEQDGITSLACYSTHQIPCGFTEKAGQEDSASSRAAADTDMHKRQRTAGTQ